MTCDGRAMPHAPAQNTDTTGLGSSAEIDAVVFEFARLLGGCAAREWVASQDGPTEGICHDQAEQYHAVVDGA
jgi:hypothetical protein